MVETERRLTRDEELAVAIQQADAAEIADGAVNRVDLTELVRVVGDLADQLGKRQLRRVPGEDEGEDGRFDGGVLLDGGGFIADIWIRVLGIAPVATVTLHGRFCLL
ncbi:MAG: hypothetical protein R2725_06680 [Solirubrobacterales bacterium]